MNTKELIQRDYLGYVAANKTKIQETAAADREALYESPLFFHGHLGSKPLLLQKIYTPSEIQDFRGIVETMHRICCKAIRHYGKSSDFRKLFPFSKELEELILADAGYPDLLPMARFDIFYREDSGEFKFCEINTDGSSAMNEDRLWNQMQQKNPAFQAMAQRYGLQGFELFDSWVDTFLSIYRGFDGAVDQPTVAIVDFMDTGTLPEFQEFQRHFEAQGVRCILCDVRELSYREGQLYGKAYDDGALVPIHAIYRRAVTSDIMTAWEQVQPLIEAVRQKAVFLCGAFRTQVVHNKAFFQVLHSPAAKDFLTAEEQKFVAEHVPFSWHLKEGGIPLEEVLFHKDRYIIKPLDAYGASHVSAGIAMEQVDWETAVRESYGEEFLCQEYYHPYETSNIDWLFGEDAAVDSFINMSGLFSYNGEFAGVYTRQSAEPLIVTYENERSVASYVAKAVETVRK